MYASGPDPRRDAEHGGVRGVLADRGFLGSPAVVPDLRPRRLLRSVKEPACHEALSRDRAPPDPVGRARRGLDLVLRRRAVDGAGVTASAAWPEIPYETWKDTKDTLHMYTQVIGKLRLALSPPEPQWAHTALYVTARGLTTGPVPFEDRVFQVDFDLIDHALSIAASDGGSHRIALVPRTVADFYAMVMGALRSLGIDVDVSIVPSEVPDPIPFPDDTVHASYDPGSVGRFWRALVQVDKVLRVHRGSFLGRSSPVNFFWGTFDLAYVRYSGRPAEPPPGSGIIYRRSADAEQICAGFWAGDERFARPAFFSYSYPKPEGLEGAEILPPAASWSDGIGEFLLPYDDVRTAASPAQDLLAFFMSTYQAGATLAGWNREALEAPEPK